MADEIKIYRNLHLVNSPAGSGKTTYIKNLIKQHLSDNPDENILCITFTNRAVNELNSEFSTEYVYIGTIHSYLNELMSGFFSHANIKELYFEIFGDEIRNRIGSKDDRIKESNQRYIEKYGHLNYETVKKNIDSISYGENKYTRVFYGALGHDDLIEFTYKAIERFPVIAKKIPYKYKQIFIDEYQDTSADVLRIFYNAVKDSKSELYLLGDRMQQIYSNYDGSFEKELKTFDASIILTNNYRATPCLVDVLNKIYNDKCYKQISKTEATGGAIAKPCVIFGDYTKLEEVIGRLKEKFPEALVLYTTNQKRFKEIGAENLFVRFNKLYPYSSSVNVTDLLTKEEEHNKDDLLKFLFMIEDIYRKYLAGNYGYIINILKGDFYKSIINRNATALHYHSDKKTVKDCLKSVLLTYTGDNLVIKDLCESAKKNNFVNSSWYEGIIENDNYHEIMQVELKEFRNLTKHLDNPNVSTQHGVKGEGHNSVIFVADDNSNLSIKMTDFLKLWSSVELTLSSLEEFMYEYEALIKQIEEQLGIECSKAKAEHFETNKESIIEYIKKFNERFQEDKYYVELFSRNFIELLSKINVTNLKKIIKKDMVKGIVNAYRLFYVGCSRAKKNLVVIMNKDIAEETNGKLRDKLEWCGFEVTEFSK